MKLLQICFSIALIIVSMAVGYYFVIALPKHNEEEMILKTLKFEEEKRLTSEKEALEQLKIEQEIYNLVQEEEESRKEKEYQDNVRKYKAECANYANEAYWSHVRLNKNFEDEETGTINADKRVWDAAQVRKDNTYNECIRIIE